VSDQKSDEVAVITLLSPSVMPNWTKLHIKYEMLTVLQKRLKKTVFECENWGSHGNECEDYSLLRCDAM
jgi:hypothetical protein